MYNKPELTTLTPKARRFSVPKPGATGFYPAPTTAGSGLSRMELRKIIIDLIG
jgi:hypothetical protein